MKTMTNSCGKKKGCHADDGLPFDSLPIPMYGLTWGVLPGMSGAGANIRALWPIPELPLDSQLEKEGPLDQAAA